jgi:hypothetical protein
MRRPAPKTKLVNRIYSPESLQLHLMAYFKENSRGRIVSGKRSSEGERR